MTSKQRITPYLWFDDQAQEAAQFYTTTFPNARMGNIQHQGDKVLLVQFFLGDQEFTALNGGPMFTFNPAVSFVIHCQGQAEVDYFWEKLTADGGEEMRCAWLKDKFGVVWQVVPDELMQLISDPDPARAQRAVGAMMQMRKIEIDKLRAAADDEGRTVITVQTTIAAPKEKVWAFWTTPAHITQWNFAADTWHCPKAENDLRVGGRFSYRMEAKDGSMGFDYAGIHSAVEEAKSLAFALDDGRTVQVHFSTVKDGTLVMETFEADASQPADMQQQGWQAILENFRKYVESN